MAFVMAFLTIVKCGLTRRGPIIVSMGPQIVKNSVNRLRNGGLLGFVELAEFLQIARKCCPVCISRAGAN